MLGALQGWPSYGSLLQGSGSMLVAAPPRPTPIPVLVGSYGSERTQPSFPRWRRGPRGLYTDEEQSYISAACVSRVGTYRALKVDEVGTAIEAPVHALEVKGHGGPTLEWRPSREQRAHQGDGVL